MRTFHPFCRVRVCAALLINTWYANDHAILDIPIDYDRYIPVALVLKFWYQNFCCSSGMLYQSIDVLTLLQSLLPPGLKTMSASFELGACQSASLTALFTPLPIHLRQFNIIYIMYGIWGQCLFKSDKRFWQGRDVKTFFLVEGRFMKTYTGCFSQGDEWGDESHGCSRNLWAVFGWLLTIDVRQARSHAEIVRTGVYAIKLFQRSIDCNTDMVEGVLQRHTIPCLVRNISKPKMCVSSWFPVFSSQLVTGAAVYEKHT